MSLWLQRVWLQRGWQAWLLWPLSLVFGAIAAARRQLYAIGVLPSYRADVPVIVVGNLIAGGSGKTPVVIALVRHLRSRGLQAGVVSRGWRRDTEQCQPVYPNSDPAKVGDEPLLIARSTGAPVYVARRRADAARALRKAHPGIDVIVCDDGLQHYGLARDIEICVFGRRLVGNGFLHPAGPLREAPSRRVDLMLCEAEPPWPGAYVLNRQLAGVAVRADGASIALSQLQAIPLLAVAGIATPQAFFDMLRARGLQLARTLSLPDHHSFADWQMPPVGTTVICTEKDAVKLWSRQPDAWAVPLQVDLPDDFNTALDQLLNAKLSSRHGPQTS